MKISQKQIDFVKSVYPQSKYNWDTDRENSVNPIFDTAQAALETGWKIKGIDNNIFGITKGSTWKGNTKLVTTTEFFATGNKTFTAPEEVLSIEYRPEHKDYRYTVKRLFRVYDSMADCLKDHNRLLKSGRYLPAWGLRDNPKEYVKAIAPIYATAKNYFGVMSSIIDTVEKIVKEQGL